MLSSRSYSFEGAFQEKDIVHFMFLVLTHLSNRLLYHLITSDYNDFEFTKNVITTSIPNSSPCHFVLFIVS